jgi:hypothetical protein
MRHRNRYARMRRSRLAVACWIAALALVACGQRTASPVPAPGAPRSPASTVLDAGADVLQAKPPVAAINSYLDGFHFYDGRPGGQMEAHHFCATLTEDFRQCVIYDGNGSDAKLMGVEYVVSASLFATLPPEEKALWHSHVYEVKSGQLVAPGLPDAAELALMSKLVGTYGKTWHTWHTDMDKQLPLGTSHLMMGFTADGQIDPAMLAGRDQRLGIETAQKRRARVDLVAPPVDPAANRGAKGVSAHGAPSPEMAPDP